MYLCAQSLVSHSNRADKKETRRCSNAFHVSHVWTPPKFSIVFMRNEAETQHLWKSQPEIIVKRRSQPLWHYGLYVLEGGEGGGSCSELFLLARVFKIKEIFHHWQQFIWACPSVHVWVCELILLLQWGSDSLCCSVGVPETAQEK